jgi:hypothetical protein
MSEYMERLIHNLRVNLKTEGATIYTVTDFIHDRGLFISVDEVTELLNNTKANKYTLLWGDTYLYISELFEDGVSP